MINGTSYTLGLWGEKCVAEFLKERGADILASRWRSPYGEVDIIAEQGEFLSFIEVKLRKNDRFSPGRAFVTKTKQRKIYLSAQMYLLEYKGSLQPRFDVAEVYASEGLQTSIPRIIYWENAF